MLDDGHLDRDDALALMQNICRALSPLHARGESHGDLTVDNVSVTSSGNVALAPALNNTTMRDDIFALGMLWRAIAAPVVAADAEALMARFTARDEQRRPRDACEGLALIEGVQGNPQPRFEALPWPTASRKFSVLAIGGLLLFAAFIGCCVG
jgi:hypothetical protein